MSRQSKAAKTKELAKSITKMHLNGARGPATTTAKHGKSPDRVYYDKDGLTEAGKKARGIKTQKKEKASA
jgi:hypothetical protein